MLDTNIQNHAEKLAEKDITIEPLGMNQWKVKIMFPSSEASESGMLSRMRTAKKMISQDGGPPVELLELLEIIEKNKVKDGLAVFITIGRIDVGQGRPRVHLESMEAPFGGYFDDMIAKLDIYYLDEFNEIINEERVMAELAGMGVDPDMCDMNLIKKTIQEVHRSQKYVEGLEIAHGIMPEQGIDAKLEYAFFSDPGEAPNIAEYRSGRKVRKKNVLAEKSPPTDGKEPGRNVRGEYIPPLRGLDFQLVAGEGTMLLSEGTVIVADRNGLAVMRRHTRRAKTPIGERIVTAKIEVSVKQLIEVDATDIEDLVVEDSVEIKGTLQKGASISTTGEVLIDGDLCPGTSVSAGADVTVYGKIDGGHITSEQSVFSTSGARDTKITAGADVNIQGTVESSSVSGRKVKIEQVKGSRIEAGWKASIKHAGNDKDGRRTQIKVGRMDLYERQLEANREVVKTMDSHLQQIRKLFGQDIIVRIGQANSRKLLFEYLRTLRQRGVVNMSNDLVQSYVKLMEAVKPIKNVIAERKEVIDQLEQRADEEKSHRPVVVISENVDDPVLVTINDKSTMLGHSKNGTAVTFSADDNICTYSLMAPSSRYKEDENDAEEEKPAKKKRWGKKKKK